MNTCDLLKESAAKRAEYAERMAKTHVLRKCKKCEKFHIWEPMDGQAQSRYMQTYQRVRFEYYVPVGNQYVLARKPRKFEED